MLNVHRNHMQQLSASKAICPTWPCQHCERACSIRAGGHSHQHGNWKFLSGCLRQNCHIPVLSGAGVLMAEPPLWVGEACNGLIVSPSSSSLSDQGVQ